MESLLRLRPLETLEGSDSKSLNHNAHNYIVSGVSQDALLQSDSSLSQQMRNLTHHILPTEEFFARTKTLDRGPKIRDHLNLVGRTCQCLAGADEYLGNRSNELQPSLPLTEAINSCISVLEGFEAWCNDVPNLFRYESIPAPFASVPCSGPDPDRSYSIHVYTNVSVAGLWNLHRICRILLIQCLNKCISLLEASEPQQGLPDPLSTFKAESGGKFQALVDDIYASVPFHLDEVDGAGHLRQPRQKKALGGLFILFPLLTLMREKIIPENERAWIVKRLSYVKHGLGIQRALFNK